MPTTEALLEALGRGSLDARLGALYGADLRGAKERWRALLERFSAEYPELGGAQVGIYSAPGRTEVGGNHTDHNAGRVLAAAVSLDALGVACPAPDGVIRLRSEGYPAVVVDTSERGPLEEERHTPAAVVRGIATRMRELGRVVGGLSCVVHSTVPEGSGLSSSASFELLVVTILNDLYNRGAVDPLECAQIGQYAENVFFGKPCGLMDQTTSAVGGVVTIDFRDAAKPLVRKLDFDFGARGIRLVVVNTGGSHADLTPEYSAIRSEMEAVARELGGKLLRDIDPQRLLPELPRLRASLGDRAVLRARHFFGDNERVLRQVEALERGELRRFLDLVVESGRSSWMLNQNCSSPSRPREQPIPLALELSREILDGQGAWRVHGGGFAGTILAFVPQELLGRYLSTMRGVFGADCCLELSVRSAGASRVDGPAGGRA